MPLLKLTPIRGQAKPTVANDGTVSIGRGPENTISLIDERASRRHCVIELDNQKCWVMRDLNSRNGTKVNEARVTSAILKPGDVLKVGSHEFLIEGDRPQVPPELHAVDFDVSSALDTAPKETKANGLKSSREVGWMFELSEVTDSLPPKSSAMETISVIDANGKATDVLAGTADGPHALRMFLQLGSKARATDIHMEPKGDMCN